MSHNNFFIQQEVKKSNSQIRQVELKINTAKTIRDCARLNMELVSSGSPMVRSFPEVKNGKFQVSRKIEKAADIILNSEMNSIKSALSEDDFDIKKAKQDFQTNFIEPCRGNFPNLHRVGSKFICAIASIQEVSKDSDKENKAFPDLK